MMKSCFFGLGLSMSSHCGSGEKPIRQVVAFLFIAGMGPLWAGLPAATCVALAGEKKYIELLDQPKTFAAGATDAFSGIIGELFPEVLVVILPFGTESLGVVAIQSVQPAVPQGMPFFF